MTRLAYADVAPLAAASALEAVTLLCASRGAASGGPPPFAPLAALPALRRALIGVGNQGPGWAALEGGPLAGAGGQAVTAYLCPPVWSELSCITVRAWLRWLGRVQVWGSPVQSPGLGFCLCGHVLIF
jgi:hypothetical protein